ncbi:MAG: penicillin acylase family protein, partial [Holophagales bacterium]|nr:penicillin acylase family protein [Holophagales bacterium]
MWIVRADLQALLLRDNPWLTDPAALKPWLRHRLPEPCFERPILDRNRDRWQESNRAHLLIGPRQAGKSAAIRMHLADRGEPVLFCSSCVRAPAILPTLTQQPGAPMRLSLLLATLLLTLLASCGPSTDSEVPQPQQAGVEVLWDSWGVPHVFADSDEGVFFAQGWVQARAHGDLVLRLYGTARGRAAEYWGEGKVESDRWVRTVGIPARAEEWWAEQGPEARRFLEAFAEGINAYAEAHPERLADEVEEVLPVTPVDVLAHVQRVIHFTFVVNGREVTGAAKRWKAARGSQTAAVFDVPEVDVPAIDGPGGEGPGGAGPEVRGSELGSNAWAVAPSRSASGHALLLANPHLPWNDLFTWFEVQLTGPSLDAYGATLVGTPFLGIAFNDYLGWTHTVNTLDAADLYELTLAEGGVEGGYVLDGEVRAFERETQTLRVPGEDGTLREEELVVHRSVHGPVVAVDGDRALALRVAGLGESGLFEQYWAMTTATNLEEFEAAVAKLQMPMFTVMYADRDGHILHLFGGRIPKRPAGGEHDWGGIVAGDTSETLWTETHSYAALPRVLDPETGWLQNANDPPWTTTFPRALDPGAFSAHMAPRFMHFRAQQSAQLLADDDSLTFEEMVAAKHSTEMEMAVRLLDDLEAAVAEHGDARAK